MFVNCTRKESNKKLLLMVVSVSYRKAINYTQEGINYYFLSWGDMLLKKLCKFRRRGFIIVAKVHRNYYQMSEMFQNTPLMRILLRLVPSNVYLFENLYLCVYLCLRSWGIFFICVCQLLWPGMFIHVECL